MKWKPLIAATVILVIGFSAWGEEDTLCPRCLRGTTIGAGVSDSIEVGGGVSDEQLCVRCLRGSGGAMPTPVPPVYLGDCCSANGSPGCATDQAGVILTTERPCNEYVCAFDPPNFEYCCDTDWDATCASLAGDCVDGTAWPTVPFFQAFITETVTVCDTTIEVDDIAGIAAFTQYYFQQGPSTSELITTAAAPIGLTVTIDPCTTLEHTSGTIIPISYALVCSVE